MQMGKDWLKYYCIDYRCVENANLLHPRYKRGRVMCCLWLPPDRRKPETHSPSGALTVKGGGSILKSGFDMEAIPAIPLPINFRPAYNTFGRMPKFLAKIKMINHALWGSRYKANSKIV
jgi:hypothetical protein